MNKKMNFLAIFPSFGSLVLLLYLSIKVFKGELRKDRFCPVAMIGIAFCFIVNLFTYLFLYAINFFVDITVFINTTGQWLAGIISLYAMNFFFFAIFNKHWNYFIVDSQTPSR